MAIHFVEKARRKADRLRKRAIKLSLSADRADMRVRAAQDALTYARKVSGAAHEAGTVAALEATTAEEEHAAAVERHRKTQR